MLTREQIRQTYNQLAPSYNRATLLEEYLFGVKRLRRRFFQGASGKILEVAAGTGKNLPYFRSDDITAVDLSVGMLQVARQAVNQSSTQVKFAIMNAENLGFADHVFDTVVSSLSTCTFPDPIKALGEMGRVCKADGHILLLEHGRSKYRLINAYLDRYAERHYQVAGCRWNQEPPDLVEQSGLRVLSVQRFFFGVFYAIEAVPA